ncbi:tyrosine-type recombinase/integrase [Actinophytocola sp.]|uniref:tyrosine-type recombinase/integrase n=1 Tax=Actinophytocola sp. TaxID=1872138 RepID=UPI003D6AEB31
MDDDWGTLVWLAMTTGMRRGELCGLRFARVALDAETLTLLREQRTRVEARLAALDRPFTDNLFVFSNARTPDHSEPYSPNAVTQRYKDMATRLGIKTHLHALRHYSATELLTAGVDLPTVAGRLGHGGGGATTLKVYAAWVAASDRKAAEILGSRMPKRHK